MSLVAYGSSDESDSEERPLSATAQSKSSAGGLFSLLPTPKTAASTRASQAPSYRMKTNLSAASSTRREDLDQPASKGDLFSSLPKPRKRTEPVKIAAPQIHGQDSDSDDGDEPARKVQVQGAGSGLSSILPQPKNLTVKEMDRPLIPHTLTKRKELKAPKPGLIGSSASPSAIKAAAKSAALQVARQMATDDQDKDDDMTPQNYFSLGESTQVLPPAVPSLDSEPRTTAEPLPYDATDELGQSDAPLNFEGSVEGTGAWADQYQQYQQPMPGPEAYPQGYFDEPNYQDPNAAEGEEPGCSAMFEDEAFMRLQGKRNRGKEEVKFLEIKGDDQLIGNKQWMTKNMTEEKETMQSYSKKRGDQPTGQQRRKHQITYLIHQARARELELKNTWAENKLSRRQTQAKYGF